MASVPELFKYPEHSIPSKGKLMNMPLDKTTEGTGYKFLKSIVQYMAMNPYTGYGSSIPEDMRMFFRSTPMHPAYGEGFAQTYLGDVLAWECPEIQIGDQYIHIKPPKPPVYEEKVKKYKKLQASIQLEQLQWRDKYIDANQLDKLLNLIPTLIKKTMINTLVRADNFFWVSLAGNKLHSDPKFFLDVFKKEAEQGNKLLLNYQGKKQDANKSVKWEETSALYALAEELIEEAKKVKNVKYFNPAQVGEWIMKADNKVEVAKVEKPEDVDDFKKYCQKVYLTEDKGKLYTITTRTHSIYALLKRIQRSIRELTNPLGTPTNLVSYDPEAVLDDNSELFPIWCDRSKLVIVCSDWDIDDLESGGQDGSNNRLTLSQVAGGIPVVSKPGIMPGTVYVGDNAVLNYMEMLEHSGQIFHERELEDQWYYNFWIMFGTFEKIAGHLIKAAANYHPGFDFLQEHWTSYKK